MTQTSTQAFTPTVYPLIPPVLRPDETEILTLMMALSVTGTLTPGTLREMLTNRRQVFLETAAPMLPLDALHALIQEGGKLPSQTCDELTLAIVRAFSAEELSAASPQRLAAGGPVSAPLLQLRAVCALRESPFELSAQNVTLRETLTLPHGPWLLLVSAPQMADNWLPLPEAKRALGVTHVEHLAAANQTLVQVAAVNGVTGSYAQQSPFTRTVSLLALRLLQDIADTNGRDLTLNPELRRAWDVAFRRLTAGWQGVPAAALQTLLRQVHFDPGNAAHLQNLGNVAYETALASCPGVPAKRVRLTSMTAARAALEFHTPSWSSVRLQKKFAKLHPGDPALSLQHAIDLAIQNGHAEGLKARKLSEADQLEAFLQTAHHPLKDPIRPWTTYSALPALTLAEAALRVIERPTDVGVTMLSANAGRLPAQLRMVITVIKESLGCGWQSSRLTSSQDLQAVIDARGTTLHQELIRQARQAITRMKAQEQRNAHAPQP